MQGTRDELRTHFHVNGNRRWLLLPGFGTATLIAILILTLTPGTPVSANDDATEAPRAQRGMATLLAAPPMWTRAEADKNVKRHLALSGSLIPQRNEAPTAAPPQRNLIGSPKPLMRRAPAKDVVAVATHGTNAAPDQQADSAQPLVVQVSPSPDPVGALARAREIYADQLLRVEVEDLDLENVLSLLDQVINSGSETVAEAAKVERSRVSHTMDMVQAYRNTQQALSDEGTPEE